MIINLNNYWKNCKSILFLFIECFLRAPYVVFNDDEMEEEAEGVEEYSMKK